MNKDKRGGARPGAGQPKKDTKELHVRIDVEAYNIIEQIVKKGEFVSQAIKEYNNKAQR